MMERASIAKPKIQEENWRVSDKIRAVRQLLKEQSQFQINRLFSAQGTRLEWIVTFLALLELMKIGEIGIGRETATQSIVVYTKDEDS
jgi:segregation and condensation protein A